MFLLVNMINDRNVIECYALSGPQKHTLEPLYIMATLETKESGRCREVTVAERFKQESMYGFAAQKQQLW